MAAGHLDGYLDGVRDQHAPWDYLGGAARVPRGGRRSSPTPTGDVLEVADADARRQLVAAGTTELLGVLRDAVAP